VSYEAKIIADSISPAGVRLTTLQVTFPRFLLPEFNTHRMLSRNSASSRAIPVKKRIEAVLADPFIPEQFGRNQKGMQAHHNLEGEDLALAREIWIGTLNVAALEAQHLDEIGVHKQLANRLLEPFMWHTVVVTATDWDNFFHLRRHPDAQPEFQKIAGMMRDVMEASEPKEFCYGDWHLPYITDEDYSSENAGLHIGAISAARCARVSYLTHEGKRDISADSALATRLLASGHLSPFEHPACADVRTDAYFGNLRGWVSYRKHIPYEQDILGAHHD
jgi:thymidylate synthase ThyX